MQASEKESEPQNMKKGKNGRYFERFPGNNKSGKAAILFDLDGTLWDARKNVAAAWNSVLYKRAGFTVTEDDLRPHMGKRLFDIGRALMPDRRAEAVRKIMRECADMENLYVEKHGGSLFEGVKETMEKLRKDYFLGIVSNCQEGYIGAFLSYYHMGHVFDDYEEAERTGLCKEDNIRLVMRRNGLSRVLYVGDTALDKKSAEGAGASFVHAAYGFGRIKEVCPSIEDIRQVPRLAADLLAGRNAFAGRDDKVGALCLER